MLNRRGQTSLNQYAEVTGIPGIANENMPSVIIVPVAKTSNASINDGDTDDTFITKPYKYTDGKTIDKFNP